MDPSQCLQLWFELSPNLLYHSSIYGELRIVLKSLYIWRRHRLDNGNERPDEGKFSYTTVDNVTFVTSKNYVNKRGWIFSEEGWSFFCGSFLLFVFAFAIVSCLFLAALWSPVDSLVCDVFLCFCHFPIRCPGSGVVLDCVDSRYLPSSFHWLIEDWMLLNISLI